MKNVTPIFKVFLFLLTFFSFFLLLVGNSFCRSPTHYITTFAKVCSSRRVVHCALGINKRHKSLLTQQRQRRQPSLLPPSSGGPPPRARGGRRCCWGQPCGRDLQKPETTKRAAVHESKQFASIFTMHALSRGVPGDPCVHRRIASHLARAKPTSTVVLSHTTQEAKHTKQNKTKKTSASIQFNSANAPLEALTKRRTYCSRLWARPRATLAFFSSLLSTLGVWFLTLPARARDPCTLPVDERRKKNAQKMSTFCVATTFNQVPSAIVSTPQALGNKPRVNCDNFIVPNKQMGFGIQETTQVKKNWTK